MDKFEGMVEAHLRRGFEDIFSKLSDRVQRKVRRAAAAAGPITFDSDEERDQFLGTHCHRVHYADMFLTMMKEGKTEQLRSFEAPDDAAEEDTMHCGDTPREQRRELLRLCALVLRATDWARPVAVEEEFIGTDSEEEEEADALLAFLRMVGVTR